MIELTKGSSVATLTENNVQITGDAIMFSGPVTFDDEVTVNDTLDVNGRIEVSGTVDGVNVSSHTHTHQHIHNITGTAVPASTLAPN